jgi:hypothetical protein
MSGLNQRFTKPPTGKTVREFESHRLRHGCAGYLHSRYPSRHLCGRICEIAPISPPPPTNPCYDIHMNELWFKRKTYGWGWVPSTKEGWLVILVYIILVSMFALTIEENSPTREIILTGILPIALLTATLIRVCYLYRRKYMIWQTWFI